ncbi:MAG: GNAT family N-acetyltransferase [Pyramidobacter sp.]|jgi:predicted N-acetyltransferase YhbS
MEKMEIRQERAADYGAVCALVKAAFSTAPRSDGNEHRLVEALRKSASFIPELSLVAVEGGQIVGHILFTKAFVGQTAVLALAPLSVLPSRQRRGIGRALVLKGHDMAKRLGYHYSVVLGDPSYYSKAGYRPARLYGITPPFDVPDENFMAVKLNACASRVTGVLKYDRAFGIDP